MHGQLDDVGLREVLPQLRPQRVVDLVVVHRQLLGVADSRALAWAQEIRGLIVDRGDLVFGETGMPGPGIADAQSVATAIESGDL